MTALVARQSLHPLPMSSAQRPARRLSARRQEKDDEPGYSAGAHVSRGSKTVASTTDTIRVPTKKESNGPKRKMVYDEEDDGFLFKRVKTSKEEVRTSVAEESSGQRPNQKQQPAQPIEQKTQPTQVQNIPDGEDELESQPRKSRKRLSFSTPNPKEAGPVRRSKRLSKDNQQQDGTPTTTRVTDPERRTFQKKQTKERFKEQPKEQTKDQANEELEEQLKEPVRKPGIHQQPIQEPSAGEPLKASPRKPARVSPSRSPKEHLKETIPTQHEDHSATKIALPFADTPVIKRNKAMREGKSGKGERRSSLGTRGRRASSLIESGSSNALPHTEVNIPDFYKHIESEGLPEPRRMKQLLTWCATRALDEKPVGTDFEDASARSAARVIQEELLKDLANKSELSDWFNREDLPVQRKPLPERPNPKNVQNTEKIAELEEQIKRLRAEKEALEGLLRPPSVVKSEQLKITVPYQGNLPLLDGSLLSEADVAALENVQKNSTSTDAISHRLNALYDSLGPTIDKFADGVHTIGQFRTVADDVASTALAICAAKLAQREKEGRRRALSEVQGSPPKDLGSVLRGLSRADR
ncbi:Mis12-Mtw1 protein family-domain-containing protein [Exophiala viscosa]|uniref:Mis12-Mtw1 protein family-domain-containing protein n=1 Tax=Exophiala viscosa TaxID=2486360 RepID=A0AAN6DXF7_9EURO|nr:Mis12-Mtw1 protein family-domain-containing protein [Exophiala viscosa]